MREESAFPTMAEPINEGNEARKAKEKYFFKIVERFRSSQDIEKAKHLGEQLGRFVFGDSDVLEESKP